MKKIIILLFGVLFLVSCRNEKKDITGVYKMDKYNLRNFKNKAKDFRYLEINPNGTFKLFYENDSLSTISGNWRLVKQSEKESVINFSYGKEQKQGALRGNVFYFIYPNDFHSDKYQNVLYVKTNLEKHKIIK